jgi:hypothetical protein
MESWMTVYNWPVFRCPQLAGFEVSPEGKLALKQGRRMRTSKIYRTNERIKENGDTSKLAN